MSVRDAVEKLARIFAQQPEKARAKNVIAMRAAQIGVTLTSLEVSVTSESDTRGLLGSDENVSAGLFGFRTHVKIGSSDATVDQLKEIVQWADAHSPVGCTMRQ